MNHFKRLPGFRHSGGKRIFDIVWFEDLIIPRLLPLNRILKTAVLKWDGKRALKFVLYRNK